MKATLEFDLNDQDDRMAHLRCVKSTEMALAIWEISTNSRKSIQRDIEDRIEFKGEDITAFDAVDMVFERIWEILHENGIVIDDLIQ